LRNRIWTVPVALLLATFLGAASTTLTTIYFPPSDSGSPLDVLMRGQFAAILAETREPVLHEPRGNTYAIRVTAYTVRGSVTFLRFERKADGSVMSTIRNFGFTELGAPFERSIVEKPIAGAQFTRLLEEIQRQNFFTMASAGTVATVDAPVCLIEVFDGRAFHSAFRAQCPRATPFGTVAMRATEIAGIEPFVN
jgi:hypothetical protein